MRILLDSCVILSRLPRELMICAAREGEFNLAYSQSIEDETMHVAHRKGLEVDIASAFIELRLYAEKVQEAVHDGLWLPDENDRHVALSAIGGQCDLICTENLRDFPKSALAPLGIEALSPDQILTPLALGHPNLIKNINPNELKRAKLYRLAKLAKKQLDEERYQ